MRPGFVYTIVNIVAIVYGTYLLGQNIPSDQFGHGLSIFFLAAFPILIMIALETLYIEEVIGNNSRLLLQVLVVQLVALIIGQWLHSVSLVTFVMTYALMQYIHVTSWGAMNQIVLPMYIYLHKSQVQKLSLLAEQIIPWLFAILPSIICLFLAGGVLIEMKIVSGWYLLLLCIISIIQNWKTTFEAYIEYIIQSKHPLK